jgi:4-carboxymuconolactone decarboxylase
MLKAAEFRTSALAAAVMLAGMEPAMPQSADDDRRRRGDAVVRSLNNGQPQPALEAMRREFPFLADATEGFALGEVWARPGLDPRARQIATVAAFAALGNTAYVKLHAGYALNIGVTEEELKEVVYLTTVHAGFPRAIDAAAALSELFSERRRRAAQ